MSLSKEVNEVVTIICNKDINIMNENVLLTKICTGCGRVLGIDKFNTQKGVKSGLRSHCKKCNKEVGDKYKEKNKDKIAIYRKKYKTENKEKIQEHDKQYYLENKEKIKESQDKYLNKSETKEKIAIYKKKYKEENLEKIQIYQKKYLTENKDKLLINRKRYKIENKDKILEKSKRYREDNVEKIKESSRKFSKNNKDKVNIQTNKRRARKRLLPSTFTLEQWEQCKIYFDNKCSYCGEELPLEMEHLIPLTKGGGYVKGNIICSCRSCNASKGNKNFNMWYPKYKFYSEECEIKILEYLKINNTDISSKAM